MQGESEDIRWDLEGESWRQEGDAFVLESRNGVQLSEGEFNSVTQHQRW